MNFIYGWLLVLSTADGGLALPTEPVAFHSLALCNATASELNKR
jgi:hypothetical protein